MVGSTHASLFTHRVHLNWTGTQNKKRGGDSLLRFHRFYEWRTETSILLCPFQSICVHSYRPIYSNSISTRAIVGREHTPSRWYSITSDPCKLQSLTDYSLCSIIKGVNSVFLKPWTCTVSSKRPLFDVAN